MSSNKLIVPTKRYFSSTIVFLLVVVLVLWGGISVITGFLIVSVNFWIKQKKTHSLLFVVCTIVFISLDSFLSPHKIFDSLGFHNLSSFSLDLLLGIYYGVCGIVLYFIYNTLKSQTLTDNDFLSWAYILPVFVVALVFSFVTNIGLNYSSLTFNRCGFPSIYDLLWERTLPKDGLFQATLQQSDLGCNLDLNYVDIKDNKDLQSFDWIQKENSNVKLRYRNSYSGGYELKDGKSVPISVWQYIRQQEIDVSSDDVLGLADISEFEATDVMQVSLRSDGLAKYTEAKCFIYGGGLQTCVVVLGYEKIVTQIVITASDVPNDEFEQLVNQVVPTASAKIYKYEAAIR